jgi:hypothetical protein
MARPRHCTCQAPGPGQRRPCRAALCGRTCRRPSPSWQLASTWLSGYHGAVLVDAMSAVPRRDGPRHIQVEVMLRSVRYPRFTPTPSSQPPPQPPPQPPLLSPNVSLKVIVSLCYILYTAKVLANPAKRNTNQNAAATCNRNQVVAIVPFHQTAQSSQLPIISASASFKPKRSTSVPTFFRKSPRSFKKFCASFCNSCASSS